MLKIEKKRINTVRFFIISHLSYHKGSQRIRYKSPLIHYITKSPSGKPEGLWLPKTYRIADLQKDNYISYQILRIWYQNNKRPVFLCYTLSVNERR